MEIRVPISVGELVDKLTILDIKAERIADPAKHANVVREQILLRATVTQSVPPSAELDALTLDLRSVNEALWVIEDEIRDLERARDFGARFIELARAVYITNDRRAALKKDINLLVGSDIVEEKSYRPY
ncbi:MAG: hypothetical protein SGJ07_09060 [Rhodospirillaceae bacterium]|nr:hypothetical protein [Rhodospirillaceae bacterium]